MDETSNQFLIRSLYIAIIYFIISVSIALLINTEYQFYNEFLSILGTGKFGWIFNIPVVVLGIISLPFYFLVYITLKSIISRQLLFILGIILAEMSSIMLILIGLFTVQDPTADIHNLVAFLYFMILMIQFPTISISIQNSIYRLPGQIRKETYSVIRLGYLNGILILVGLLDLFNSAYLIQKIVVAINLYYLYSMGKILQSILGHND